MAEHSAISWTKSTFNPWIGCTRVGPGCDHCYAAVSSPARTMNIQWGAGNDRHRTSRHNWNQPLRWNRQAPDTEFAGIKGFWPVFCASLADVFDNEVPTEWRDDLWALIAATPNLTWLLVTKRIGNVQNMLPPGGLPRNVWLLITVVNQDEADRDIPKLLRIDATIRGISYEPALGPVNFTKVRRFQDQSCHREYIDALAGRFWTDYEGMGIKPDRFGYPGVPFSGGERGLDWVIVGGESDQGGARARPFVCGWGKDVVQQCYAADVAVFVKQLGSNATNREGEPHPLIDRAGADLAEWPAALQVQEFPLVFPPEEE